MNTETMHNDDLLVAWMFRDSECSQRVASPRVLAPVR